MTTPPESNISSDEETVEIPQVDVIQIAIQRFDIGDHMVELRTELGRQELWIDGVHQPYFVNQSGYVLYRNAYQPPLRSLLEAAQAFLAPNTEDQSGRMWQSPGIAIDPFQNDEVFIPRSTCERKNFVALTRAERIRLAAALNDAYARDVVESFANEHADNWFNVHFGPAFLPWHRHFLLRFERELQRYDSRVFLPYWDWTRQDSRDIDETTTWKPFFGGRSNQGGQFDHWRPLVRGDGSTGSLPRLEGQSGILANVQASNYRSYAEVECLTHHGGPHQWVGGDMNSAHSPRDPLFFLHHCNVDRLWAMWQRNHPDQAQYSSDSNLTGCWSYPGSVVDLNDLMAGGATPASMLDHQFLGYFYGKDDAIAAALPSFDTGDVTGRLITPTRVSFGNVVVGDIRFRTVFIRNTGPQELDVSVESQPPGQGQFVWSARNERIGPCGTRELAVDFRPAGVGQASDQLNVVSNPLGSPQDQTTNTVILNGNGIGGPIP